MTKKQKILGFLVLMPIILANLYNKYFERTSDWRENYQNHIKITLLLVSLISSIWIIIIAKKDQSKLWMILGILLTICLAIYLYIGVSIISMSFP